MCSPSTHISSAPEHAHEPLYPFPDQIHIQDKQSAKVFAETIDRQPVSPRTLIIWADGSANPRTNDPCAGAISYIHPVTNTRTDSIAISHLSESVSSEIIALWEAFQHAAALTEHFDELIVFSDCQSALCMPLLLNHPFAAKSLIDDVLEWANRFYDQGIQVNLHWTPRDVHVEAQKRVDQLARVYRRIATLVAPKEIMEYDIPFPPISFAPQPEVEALAMLRDALRETYEEALVKGTAAKRKQSPERKGKGVESKQTKQIEQARKRKLLAKEVEKEEELRKKQKRGENRKRRQALKNARQAEKRKIEKQQSLHFQEVFMYGIAADKTNCRCLGTCGGSQESDYRTSFDVELHLETPWINTQVF
jgi:ribonuclease HI